ncbi:hypothetical protein MXB_2305 [Myxobolus squamalis]|nr:hypothetical protein MXB_2305 [Myxobolus squamalis]
MRLVRAGRADSMELLHNDMGDLESKLKQIQLLELSAPKKFKNVRKFIIIEGIYLNYGDIVDLRQIVEFKYRYKTRIFIDESLSMGVLGETGRGVTEHLGVDIKDIDLISFSFEYAFASAGGACIGGSYAIDHQVILLISNPSGCLDWVIAFPPQAQYTFVRLNKRLQLIGSINSPIFHIRFCPNLVDYDIQTKLFNSIVLRENILILCPLNFEDKEFPPLPPRSSMRISLNCALTEPEINNAIRVFCRSIDEEFVSLLVTC